MSEEIPETGSGSGRLVGCLFLALFAGLCLAGAVGLMGLRAFEDVLGGARTAVTAPRPPREPQTGPPSLPLRRNLDGPWQVEARFGGAPSCVFRISPAPPPPGPPQIGLLDALGMRGVPCQTRIVCEGEQLFVAREGLLCDRRYGSPLLFVHTDEEAGAHAFELDEGSSTVRIQREGREVLEGRILSLR